MITCTVCINNLSKMNDEFENAITQWQLEKTPENAKRVLDAGNALKQYIPFEPTNTTLVMKGDYEN